MNTELDDLYQEVLLDHAKRPRNFGELADGAVHVHGDNPSCGDEIHLHVRFGPDRSVEEIKFTGQGCAISLASASLMTMKLRGQSAEQANQLACAMHDLITGELQTPPRALGDLRALSGVRKFPQRVKCAMLPWRAFEQAFADPSGTTHVSTEEA